MKAIRIFPVILVILTGCGKPTSSRHNVEEFRDGTYIWRPSAITLSFHDGDHGGVKGKYLRLDQKLADGEIGWSMSIMDLPETWEIQELGFQGLGLRFKNQHGETFLVQPPVLNKLDFAILDGGNKDDQTLEALWRKYALEKK